MQQRDIDKVIDIERRVYEFPWTIGIFQDCMKIGYVCRVFERQSDIVGYGIMSVGTGECHILNVCVAPDHQRRGLGGLMVDRLITIAKRNKVRIAFLEVRLSNERAFKLYSGMGFNEIGRREDYYPASGGARESALVLAKMLS
jgi:ribosomal-protein-alanine N-acetyltransferase